ncbi:hypothetical protein K2P47_00900 [Patescibacteria group bacterium]|nr:hypothetical protein [Patescibacteria group bacterium]
MKKALFIVPLFVFVALSTVANPAQALSCLPTDMYITSIIGNDDTVIFVAKTDSTIEATDYTAEALTVTTAYQGYVEAKLMAYHRKDATWGYLCNSGPKGTNTESVYIATKDAAGKYQVSQRLDMDSNLLPDIKEMISDKEVVGEIIEFNKTDRINQIGTTIMELLQEVMILLKEQMYWKSVK